MEDFKIVQVIPHNDYLVDVYCNNGLCYRYNAKTIVNKYRVLQDLDIFINTCTIINETLAWDLEGNKDDTKCIDVAHESIVESECFRWTYIRQKY